MLISAISSRLSTLSYHKTTFSRSSLLQKKILTALHSSHNSRTFTSSTSLHSRILIFGDHDGNALHSSVSHAVNAAKQLAEKQATSASTLSLLILHDQANNVVEQARSLPVSEVISVNHPTFKHSLTENVSKLVASLLQQKSEKSNDKYDIFITPNTSNGKNILPRVAMEHQVSPITEVVCSFLYISFSLLYFHSNDLRCYLFSSSRYVSFLMILLFGQYTQEMLLALYK